MRSMKEAEAKEYLIQKRNGPVSKEEEAETMQMLLAPRSPSWLWMEEMCRQQKAMEARENREKTDRWLKLLATENPDLIFPQA